MGVGFVQPVHTPAAPLPPPAALAAAIADERVLLAHVTAALRAQPQLRTVLVQLRRDHSTHLRALLAAAAGYSHSTSTTPRATATPARSALDRSALRAGEQHAATIAAERAGRLHGRLAALLASISACETTHTVLLEPAAGRP